MYVKYNDYELIYLIKEGSEEARRYFFMKYSTLVNKIYREGLYYKKYYYSDFLQEGLMILEKTIESYNSNYTFDFYNYFKLCFSRRLMRVERQGSLMICEKNVGFKMIDTVDKSTNSLINRVEKTIQEEDEFTKKIIKECLFDNLSLKTFCKKYDLDYQKTYYLYRKIKSKLENLLTN